MRKQSGVKSDRAALACCMRSLEPGDTVLITKLDRLARSTRGSLNALATIGEAGANFKSLGDPWADTTTPHGRLMLTVLGGLAEEKTVRCEVRPRSASLLYAVARAGGHGPYNEVRSAG